MKTGTFLPRTMRILGALSVSVLFGYLALRSVQKDRVVDLVWNAKPEWIFAFVACLVLGQVLRSIRWAILLNPVEPVRQKFLFPILSIGFMFIMILPARLGELTRPILLSRNSSIPMSSALATVVAERLLDVIMLFMFFGLAIWSMDFPRWVVRGGLSVLAIVALIALVLALGTYPAVRSRLKGFMGLLPKKGEGMFRGIFDNFYLGLESLRSGRNILLLLLLTVGIWCLFALSSMVMFRTFRISLGPLAAVTVIALTALGISVPAGPGFIGNYHYFCILALGLFGIGKDQALSYALVNHAMLMLTHIALGTFFLVTTRMRLGLIPVTQGMHDGGDLGDQPGTGRR